MKLFITGGTGSFGSAFIQFLIDLSIDFEKVTVYSRDWQKQKELRDKLKNNEKINWVIGDVRDKERLAQSIKGHDVVIHASAIKCIEACENNPTECLETNVIGTQNVIDVMPKGAKGILISTDKAVLPINVYGTSKKMAEKLWISCGYSVCRYGNVIGSNGSVLPLYRKLIREGAETLPVTDVRMTRFWFPMVDAILFVLDSIEKYVPGHVYIPEIPSIRIIDLVEALDMPYHVIGLREGEKLFESMIPPDPITGYAGYDSETNPHFLTIEEIKKSIKYC